MLARWAVAGLVITASLGAGCTAPGDPRGSGASRRFEHTFAQLALAVENDEDEVARRILAGIRARGPRGRDAELVEGYEAILDGRDLARELHFALVVEELDEAGAYRVVLSCSSTAEEPVVLDLPPPTLERLTTWVSPMGSDARDVEHQTVAGFTGGVLPPGGELRIDLGEQRVSLGNALAQRDRWRLTLRSGTSRLGDRTLPLQTPTAETCERVHLAPFLPTEELHPGVLVEYVQRERIAVPPLMERAVRIPPERWNEALELVASIAPELSDERLSTITPALRWLSRSARLGGDPRSWRVVLASADAPSELPQGLDLPSRQLP